MGISKEERIEFESMKEIGIASVLVEVSGLSERMKDERFMDFLKAQGYKGDGTRIKERMSDAMILVFIRHGKKELSEEETFTKIIEVMNECL